MSEHAVIVHIPLIDGGLLGNHGIDRLFELEDKLAKAIENAHVGEYDGNELGQDEAAFFMYGPDADRLFAAARKVLAKEPLPKGSFAICRWGSASDLAARVERRDLA